jgi:hypothetical protein
MSSTTTPPKPTPTPTPVATAPTAPAPPPAPPAPTPATAIAQVKSDIAGDYAAIGVNARAEYDALEPKVQAAIHKAYNDIEQMFQVSLAATHTLFGAK